VDAFGNLVTSYSGPVSLASSDGQNLNLPSGISLLGGVATTTVTLDRANSIQLVATAGILSGTSGSVTVNSAAATQLVFTTPPPASVQEFSPFGATVQMEDQYGNAVSQAGVAISFQQPGTNTLTGGNAITTNAAGQTVFTNLEEGAQAGTFTLEATAAGLSSASVEISVLY